MQFFKCGSRGRGAREGCSSWGWRQEGGATESKACVRSSKGGGVVGGGEPAAGTLEAVTGGAAGESGGGGVTSNVMGMPESASLSSPEHGVKATRVYGCNIAGWRLLLCS